MSEDVNANTPPVASTVVLTPQGPLTGDDVVVSYTYSDDDNDGESGTTFAWHLNGALQVGTHRPPALLGHHKGRFMACRSDAVETAKTQVRPLPPVLLSPKTQPRSLPDHAEQ